jgi:CheY-like chemotaxis protein
VSEELCQCGFGEEYFTIEDSRSVCTVCGGTVVVKTGAATEERGKALGKNILIVDDQGFFRKRIHDILTGQGHRVLEASDGLEAVAHVARSLESGAAEPSLRVEIVILDLVMPGLIDGFQTLGVIKAMDQKLPVLVLTSSPPAKDLLKKLGSLRAKKYLNKASKDLEGLLLKNLSSL